MKNIFIIIVFLLISMNLSAQTNYKGCIDKYPIELVANIYLDGEVKAIYTYKKNNNPIVINGRQYKDTLILYEKNQQGKTIATLTFLNFDNKKDSLIGTWKSLLTKQELPIRINREFELNDGDSIYWEGREIIQQVSLKNFYFKLVVSKTIDSYYPKVSGIKIFKKVPDSLIQFIKVDCEKPSLSSIEIEDYNFDGVKDFSILEFRAASGSNSSRIYFLYDSKRNFFFNSNFEGSSLIFDHQKNRIYEHSQCCAGTSQMSAEYKVVNNKMILVKRVCIEYDTRKKSFKKVKCD